MTVPTMVGGTGKIDLVEGESERERGSGLFENTSHDISIAWYLDWHSPVFVRQKKTRALNIFKDRSTGVPRYHITCLATYGTRGGTPYRS